MTSKLALDFQPILIFVSKDYSNPMSHGGFSLELYLRVRTHRFIWHFLKNAWHNCGIKYFVTVTLDKQDSVLVFDENFISKRLQVRTVAFVVIPYKCLRPMLKIFSHYFSPMPQTSKLVCLPLVRFLS